MGRFEAAPQGGVLRRKSLDMLSDGPVLEVPPRRGGGFRVPRGLSWPEGPKGLKTKPAVVVAFAPHTSRECLFTDAPPPPPGYATQYRPTSASSPSSLQRVQPLGCTARGFF